MSRQAHIADPPASSRTRKRWGVGLVVVTTAIALAGGTLIAGFAMRPQAPTPAFEAFVPKSTALLARLDATAANWKTAAALVPGLELDGQWADAKSDADAIGVTWAPASSPQEGRALYIEARSGGAAKRVVERLQDAPGAGVRAVGRHGATIIVTDMTAEGLAAANRFGAKSTQSTALRDDLASARAANALWVDGDLLAKYASAGSSAKQRESAGKFAAQTLGVTSGMRWLGTPDPGNEGTWSGRYLDGGVDLSKLNPGSAVNAARVTSGKTVDVSRLVTATTATYATTRKSVNEVSIGTIGDLGEWTKGLAKTAPLTLQLSLSGWLASASGGTEVGEAISTLNVSASTSRLSLAFVFNDIDSGDVVKPSDAPSPSDIPTVTPAAPEVGDWSPGDYNPVTDGARDPGRADAGSTAQQQAAVPEPTEFATPSTPAVEPREPDDLGTGSAYDNPIPEGFGSGG